MRVLVISVPRSCSTITTTTVAQKFGLLNISETFANSGLNTNIMNGDRLFTQRNPSANLLPLSLETEDNYCGKILCGVFIQNRISYSAFNWSCIDKIVFTTRANVVDQVASWLMLSVAYKQYRRLSDIERKKSTSKLGLDGYSQMRASVTFEMMPYIIENFTIFRTVRDYLYKHYPNKCATVSYEMYQSPDAAQQLSAATNWNITPEDLPIKNDWDGRTNKNYSVDVSNYDILRSVIQKAGLMNV